MVAGKLVEAPGDPAKVFQTAERRLKPPSFTVTPSVVLAFGATLVEGDEWFLTAPCSSESQITSAIAATKVPGYLESQTHSRRDSLVEFEP